MDNVVVVAKLLKWNEIDNLLQLTLDDTTGVLTTKNY